MSYVKILVELNNLFSTQEKRRATDNIGKKIGGKHMVGTVTVSVDKKCLRLQFPSTVSKKIWNVRQKYKTLGLSDNPENRAIAQQLASKAQMDILSDSLDITLEKYNPLALEKTSKQVKPKIPKLIDLYTEFIETTIKPRVDQSTYRKYRVEILNRITDCANANIVADSLKIFDTLKAVTTPEKARESLDVLHKLLEWCKRKGIVEINEYNPYKPYKEDIPGKSKQVKPKHIIEQNLLAEDDDYRGYSPEEAEHIIEAFLFKGKTPRLYYSLALFLFLTGCRPSEAVGLQWGDINEDCSVIIFCHVLCNKTREEKGLKTSRFGKTKRRFPCGERLKGFLKEMREMQGNPPAQSKVFLTEKGKPIHWDNFYGCWAGKRNKFGNIDGVIEILSRENKVKYYLKPYATRHSFITWQLANGMTPANVAKLVGNTPQMIYEHYISTDENITLAFEL